MIVTAEPTPRPASGKPDRDAVAALSVRAAVGDDLARIVEIYNHYIENTPVSFETERHTGDASGLRAFRQAGHTA